MRKYFFILSACLFLFVVAIAGNLRAEPKETSAPLAPAFLDGDWVVEEKVACCTGGETFSSSWTFTYLSDVTIGGVHAKVYGLAAVRTSGSTTRYGVGLEIGKKLVIFQDCYDYPGQCHHEIFTKKAEPTLSGKLKCACDDGKEFPGNFTAHR